MKLSNEFRVVGQKRKTGAKFFRDVKGGDILSFAVDIEHSYYATDVDIKNLTQGTEHSKTMGALSHILDAFEFEKVS